MPRMAIAVVGAGNCSADEWDAAFTVGRLIADAGAVLVTGGMTGVMEAASRGAQQAGGLVVGILPGLDPAAANPSVDVAIPTGMGQLRNGLVVSSARAVIAVGGEWGTLSEIGLALKLGIPVIGWNTWTVAQPSGPRHDIEAAESPEAAVERALSVTR